MGSSEAATLHLAMYNVVASEDLMPMSKWINCLGINEWIKDYGEQCGRKTSCGCGNIAYIIDVC
jgi:hypothetical protein